jgi:hypothetical protein
LPSGCRATTSWVALQLLPRIAVTNCHCCFTLLLLLLLLLLQLHQGHG